MVEIVVMVVALLATFVAVVLYGENSRLKSANSILRNVYQASREKSDQSLERHVETHLRLVRELGDMADRMARLKAETQLVDAPPELALPDPEPELTGDLHKFVHGIEFDHVRDEIQAEARRMIKEGIPEPEVLKQIRGSYAGMAE